MMYTSYTWTTRERPLSRLAWLHITPAMPSVAYSHPLYLRRYHCGFFTAQFQAKHGRG